MIRPLNKLRAQSQLFQYTVFVGGGGYFEGVKSVGDITPERLEVYYPHALVCVQGQSLRIEKYIDGDLQIEGRIQSVQTIYPEGGAE